ncbi:MAG: 4-hydroxy-tetrahydrodipicolinate synthase [Flavobacteriaceae bacterium]|nr:4-hydroxy-tetrahydrodipicolinate synthase [Flavobacteriaceae bacterium]
MNLKGLGVAMITPFTEEGRVDYTSIPSIVENITTGRADYIVLMGTTAESSCLTIQEKQEVIKAVVEANQNRLPLVIGIGGNNTAKVVEEIQTTDLTPFKAILSVSPYYNKPTQEGIYQHYKKISNVSPLPLIVYNVPSRTGTNIEVETFVRLATDFENIIAIKEASGEMSHAESILKNCPSHIQVISGEDSLNLPMLLAGAVGTISVLGNALPVPIVKMFHYVEEGEFTKAYKLHYQLLDIISLLFEEGNPTGIKALMESLSFCKKTVRLPLVSASEGLCLKIEKALENSL